MSIISMTSEYHVMYVWLGCCMNETYTMIKLKAV